MFIFEDLDTVLFSEGVLFRLYRSEPKFLTKKVGFNLSFNFFKRAAVNQVFIFEPDNMPAILGLYRRTYFSFLRAPAAWLNSGTTGRSENTQDPLSAL